MPDGYELVGGTPVTVEPLEVSENGTYQQPRGKAYNPVKVNVESSPTQMFYAVYRRHVEEDPDSGDEVESFTCDQTLEEILSAINAGTPVAAKYYDSDEEGLEDWSSAPPIYVNNNLGNAGVNFGYTIIEPGETNFYYECLEISHYESGDIEVLQTNGYLEQAGN